MQMNDTAAIIMANINRDDIFYKADREFSRHQYAHVWSSMSIFVAFSLKITIDLTFISPKPYIKCIKGFQVI